MLLIQGLTAGIPALIDHFKAKRDELDKAAEKAKRKHDEINQYLRDAEKGLSLIHIFDAVPDSVGGGVKRYPPLILSLHGRPRQE